MPFHDTPPAAMTPGRRSDRLIITRASAQGAYRGWLEPTAARDFDLWLSCFEPVDAIGPDAADACTERSAVSLERRAGTKVSGLARLLHERRAELAHYRFVALFDDDLEIDAAALSHLFDLAERGNYRICQPSLTHDSHYSHAIVVHQPGLSVRHVNFVEMMCPVFRTDVLMDCLPLFDAGLESGIDMLWCHVGDPAPGDHAILDEVIVRHGRAVGSRMADNGFVDGRRYEDDVTLATERWALPRTTALAFSAVDRRGRRRASRTGLLLSCLGVADAPFHHRPVWRRLRAVLVLWVRTATARPRYRSVVLESFGAPP